MRRVFVEKALFAMLAGCCVFGAYGVVVNIVRWDSSKLLGVYQDQR